jgi:ATP-dependent protease ClpP protease subunit
MNRLFVMGLIAVVLMVGIEIQVHAKTYYLHLPSPILPGNLENQIDVLNKAKKGDIVKISTDSPGGEVNEMLKMIIAVKESKAQVLCYVDRFTASAAALITVSCDSFTMKPKALILFHMPSRTYAIGDVEIVRDIITVDDMCPHYVSNAIQFANLMEMLGVRRMMTSQQWENMLYGDDIILSPKDILRNYRSK